MSAESLAGLLDRPDESLFTHGTCDIFATKLHELFGYPLRACWKNNKIVHCYAIRDGEGIDAKGSIRRPDFCEEFTFDQEKDITPSELVDHFSKLPHRKEWEEISDGKSFNQVVSERAERFITANRHRFAPRP